MNLYSEKKQSYYIWNISGDFGEFNPEVKVTESEFRASNGKIEVLSSTDRYDNGVYVRKGRVKNVSDSEITLNTLSSKFTLDGGEYEVYSQSNSWQNESEGRWQSLVSSVSAYSNSVRNTCGAVPYMVLWSNQECRGVAFHMIAYSTWEMKVSRTHLTGEYTIIEAEFGVLDNDFMYTLMPGEEIELPEIIYYEVQNRTDMDCWKLHCYINDNYPKKTMPVVYNTWLYKYHRFTFEDILSQVSKAGDVGAEYFVIDAGWFGKKEDWFESRGDWVENLYTGFKGRMNEIADEVRKSGMKFGVWLEPECAHENSGIVKQHPEYFLKGDDSLFLDFANDEAREYIFKCVCELIDKYDVKYLKFDFNADLRFDKHKSAFIKYFKGHRKFIDDLYSKYDDLYILNCASGGMRMSVRDALMFDGFWPTDNQSPYVGMRIFKDSILRMPPQWIDSWVSIRSAEKFCYDINSDEMTDRIFSTNDATWTSVVNVDKDYLCNFMKGRSVGLSFDLNLLSEKDYGLLKNHIEEFKIERDFWMGAQCRILCDTKTMLVIEFSDKKFSQIEILSFSAKSKQKNVCVYPVVNNTCDYKINDGEIRTSTSLIEEGINISVAGPYTSKAIKLMKAK